MKRILMRTATPTGRSNTEPSREPDVGAPTLLVRNSAGRAWEVRPMG